MFQSSQSTAVLLIGSERFRKTNPKPFEAAQGAIDLIACCGSPALTTNRSTNSAMTLSLGT